MIAQLYGAVEFHRVVSGIARPVFPVLITTYELSEEAKRFAKHLKMTATEHYPLKSHPMIKCNILPSDGEKIYHLPMDQQYDRLIVGDQPGEFYAWTISEAEGKGFRRAFRWQGEGNQ